MESYSSDETIAGIATAPGRGGVGVIRVSGADSRNIAGLVFQAKSGIAVKDFEPRKLYFGVISENGNILDEGMAVLMKAPHSFTGEDVVELQLHGSPVVLAAVMRLLISAGCRPAGPGEFTRRAFLNGRIDLTRAESIQQLIAARTETSASLALRQMQGALHSRILDFKEDASWILAVINAGMDFADEDITFSNFKQIEDKLHNCIAGANEILEAASRGRIYEDGLSIVLFGRPNVGKSSIMNRLLNESRSIVSDEPGTTRDTISESFDLFGIPARLTDTAGIRDTAQTVELEGIRRAQESIRKADLAVWVVDSSNPNYDDFESLETEPGLIILNKADISSLASEAMPEKLRRYPKLKFCALLAGTAEELRRKLHSLATGGDAPPMESIISVNTRQKVALEQALKSLEACLNNHRAKAGDELLAWQLSEALSFFDEIIGKTTPDEILNKIVSRFCFGK